jgi:hypothetical protein
MVADNPRLRQMATDLSDLRMIAGAIWLPYLAHDGIVR